MQAKKHSYQLALGGHAPTPEGARYVQVSVDHEPPQVLVVGKAVADDLAVELDAFRLRSLVSVNEADVTRIGITSPKSSIALQRSTGTNFLLDAEQQSKVLANRETLKSLVLPAQSPDGESCSSRSPKPRRRSARAPAHFEIELKELEKQAPFRRRRQLPR